MLKNNKKYWFEIPLEYHLEYLAAEIALGSSSA
jgi:hypothetical protein